MWKWSLINDVDFNFLYILLFTAVGMSFVYGVNFIYQKIKRSLKR